MENSITNKADVIIAGAGIAGMVTALELLNYGKKVVLIDRDKPEKMGGLAKESFGGMFFVNTPEQRKSGIKDSTELALNDWKSFAEFKEYDYWPQKWAEHYVNLSTSHVYQWLKKHKVTFFPVVHWVERGLFKPGNSVPRFHMVWGTGHGLVHEIQKAISNHNKSSNLTVLFRHKVEDFIIENNAVKGVTGINEEKNVQFRAEAESVVIATGGICGNIEKVKKHWYPEWGKAPDVVLNGANPLSDGTLHDSAQKINANVTHLENAWHYAAGVNHPRPHFNGHGLSLVPPKSALWLKYNGERFAPIPLITAYDTRFLVEQICRQEKKYSWQVLNLKIAIKELAVSGAESNRAIRDKNWLLFLKTVLFGNKELVNDLLSNCPDFVTANSLDELAQKMNKLAGTNDVDINILKKTVKEYDDIIDRGKQYFNDEQLRRIAHVRQYKGDRVRTCKFQKINDKNALPLIAIREHILSRKTLGGIQTDLNCRVLAVPSNNNSQSPINGLYAVGEAAGFGGGGSHGIRSLEGTFLGTCVLTGRIAAASICDKMII